MRLQIATSNPRPGPWTAIGVATLTLGLLVVPFLLRARIPHAGVAEDWARIRQVSWLLDMVLVLTIVVVLGSAIRGGWFGWLVNQENQLSLTRLQIVLWTTLTVAAVFAAGVTDALRDPATGFGLEIPAQLWLLLGINIASATGTAILLGSKRHEEPTLKALEMAGFSQPQVNTFEGRTVVVPPNRHAPTGTQIADGILTKNETPEQARFIDLFTGDELATSPYLDVGKVQMFLFTAIAVFGYGLAIGTAFAATPTEPFAFPAFSEGLLALIAVSHAGYLANLAPNRTETDD
jgi:hypothetical protein